MTQLFKKGKKFEWKPECEASFHELKKRLTAAPVLATPDINKEFVIYCVASKTGLSGVLMQDGRFMAYLSRQLRPHEEKYATHDLELPAVVHALKTWRHYLLGKRCKIYTYHNSLKYIFTRRELNMRQRRWLELIKDYDLNIQYHPSKANVLVDALRRKASTLNVMLKERLPALYEEMESFGLELVEPEFLANLDVKPTLADNIKESQKGHKSIEGIKIKIQEGKAPEFSVDEQGVVWFGKRLCVPNKAQLKYFILQEAHDTPYSIHPGGTKMYQDLRERFWWHVMKREIASYVAKCDV
ncbi:hypothetical protein ZWY2020_010863 [Hordeum vulgare]|nr:hypothetical protein ZWY2020_010863 [Hordeum vulgare]